MSETLADLFKENTRLQAEKSRLIMDVLEIQNEQIQVLAGRVSSLEQKMLALYAERHRRIWSTSQAYGEEEE